jgi:LuxR family maltose regulon positive regulatory protein
VYQQALAANTDLNTQPSPLAGDVLVGLGQLRHEWNDLPLAVELLQQGLIAGEQTANWWTTVRAATALAWSQQAQGDSAAGLATLQRVETLALQRMDMVEMSQLLTQRARLHLATGNRHAVAQWLDAWAPAPAEPANSLNEPLVLMRTRALIALGRPADALPLLRQLRDAATAAGRMGSLIPIHALEACAFHATGDRPGATARLEQALELAEPSHYIRTFVDEGPLLGNLLRSHIGHRTLRPYVEQLLAAFPPLRQKDPTAYHQAPTPSWEALDRPDPEPLSAREIELLRLLAAGLSNREIAERLIITVGTVKWYFNHLYAKLGVRGRLEAVARARALGILP